MLVLTAKESLIELSNYVLKNENNEVKSKVLIKSALDCVAYRNRLQKMVDDAIISSFHRDKLIENAHTGTPKPEYFIEDPNIREDHLNTQEFIDFTEGSIEEIPFTAQNTVLEAIDIVAAMGYTFQRIIANNLL